MAPALQQEQDPALVLAVSIDDADLKAVLRRAVPRDGRVQLGRYPLSSKAAPAKYADDYSTVLPEPGIEFEQAGDRDFAGLAYQVGLCFYPEHEGPSRAMMALDSA